MGLKKTIMKEVKELEKCQVGYADNSFFIEEAKAFIEKEKRERHALLEEIKIYTEGKQIVLTNCR